MISRDSDRSIRQHLLFGATLGTRVLFRLAIYCVGGGCGATSPRTILYANVFGHCRGFHVGVR